MSRMLVIATMLFCFVLLGEVRGQADRGRELAAALDKTKYKKKEKKNVSIEVYVDVKNSPVVKNNLAEFSGAYTAEDNDYTLNLRVAADGSAEGSGLDSLEGDSQQRANFALKNARVTGSVLSGTKVFTDGRSEPFEAVFVTRATAVGKNPGQIDERKTSFGLGFIQSNKSWTNRVFLEAR